MSDSLLNPILLSRDRKPKATALNRKMSTIYVVIFYRPLV